MLKLYYRDPFYDKNLLPKIFPYGEAEMNAQRPWKDIQQHLVLPQNSKKALNTS